MLLQPGVKLDEQWLLSRGRGRGRSVGLVLRLQLLRRQDLPAELARPEGGRRFPLHVHQPHDAAVQPIQVAGEVQVGDGRSLDSWFMSHVMTNPK